MKKNKSGEQGEDGHHKKTLEHSLYEAMASLKTPDECRRFFADLCTVAEVEALADRWHVAQILDKNDISYRDIYEETGVSVTTVGRVARFLFTEKHQGYRLVLDRIRKRDGWKRKKVKDSASTVRKTG